MNLGKGTLAPRVRQHDDEMKKQARLSTCLPVCSRGSVLIWVSCWAAWRSGAVFASWPCSASCVTLGNYRDSAVVPRLRAMVTESTCETQEVLGRKRCSGHSRGSHRHPFLISDTGSKSWKGDLFSHGTEHSYAFCSFKGGGRLGEPRPGIAWGAWPQSGHTIVVKTFDSGITRGRGGAEGNETCCGHTRSSATCVFPPYL